MSNQRLPVPDLLSDDRESPLRLINLMPHDIRLQDAAGRRALLPASGLVARCSPARSFIRFVTLDGLSVPVYHTQQGPVRNLPDPQPGILYVVSSYTALAALRPDLVIPDSIIRQGGRPVACRSLSAVCLPEWEGGGDLADG